MPSYFKWNTMRQDGRTNLQYAIDLYRQDDLGPTEIASKLSTIKSIVSETAVKTRLQRACKDYNPKSNGGTNTITENDDEVYAGSEEIKRLLNEKRLLVNKLTDERIKDNLIVKAWKEAARALPTANPLPPIKKHSNRYRPHLAVAINSDMQIGTFIKREELGNVTGGFSFDIFKERATKWIDTIIQIADLHRNSYDVDILEIPFLGDNVENEIIFESQPHHIDMNVLDQATEGAYVLACGLRRLIEEGGFKTVRTRWVSGNHGRPGRKGANHPLSNWDTVFAHNVEHLCSNTPEIEFLISGSSFMLYEIPELPKFRWLLTHGDQIKSTLSIPYYGLDRAVNKFTQLGGMHIDYMLVGHHHRKAQIDGVRGEQIMNGNWVGGSDFSVNQLMTAGHAKQTMLMMHEDNGIVASHDIYLYRMQPMEINDLGVYSSLRNTYRPLPGATVNARSYAVQEG